MVIRSRFTLYAGIGSCLPVLKGRLRIGQEALNATLGGERVDPLVVYGEEVPLIGAPGDMMQVSF